MKKLQTEAYFNGGPWGGKYKWVDQDLHTIKVPERGIGTHLYQEACVGTDRVFAWAGILK